MPQTSLEKGRFLSFFWHAEVKTYFWLCSQDRSSDYVIYVICFQVFTWNESEFLSWFLICVLTIYFKNFNLSNRFMWKVQMRSKACAGYFVMSIQTTRFYIFFFSLKAVDIVEAHYLCLHYKHYSCCLKHSREHTGDIKMTAAQQKEVRSSTSEFSHETCATQLFPSN